MYYKYMDLWIGVIHLELDIYIKKSIIIYPSNEYCDFINVRLPLKKSVHLITRKLCVCVYIYSQFYLIATNYNNGQMAFFVTPGTTFLLIDGPKEIYGKWNKMTIINGYYIFIHVRVDIVLTCIRKSFFHVIFPYKLKKECVLIMSII